MQLIRPIESRKARLEKMDWHRWFAWYPVLAKRDDEYVWVWLESVMRLCCWAQGWPAHKYRTLVRIGKHL